MPARHFLSEYLNGSHIRELAAEAFVVLFGGGAEVLQTARLQTSSKERGEIVEAEKRERSEESHEVVTTGGFVILRE